MRSKEELEEIEQFKANLDRRVKEYMVPIMERALRIKDRLDNMNRQFDRMHQTCERINAKLDKLLAA